MGDDREWQPMDALPNQHRVVWIAGKFGDVWATGGTERRFDAEFGRIAWMPYDPAKEPPTHPTPTPEPSCWSGPDLDRAYRGDLKGAITTWIGTITFRPDPLFAREEYVTPTPTPAAEPDGPWRVVGGPFGWGVDDGDQWISASGQEHAEFVAAALNRTCPTIPADVQAVVDAAKAWRNFGHGQVRPHEGSFSADLAAAVDALLAKEAGDE